ncbi:RND transporter [Primorskyibacter aestuariivivens]|uniref:RND transporter n=1 Tax=Primorskyibacter aestuariivivens TaxID=1888912 RepID=UPI0023002447|nr:RND transporter [Primorskyibacter aestuariivivens]MDA7428610.1 RND transporter [Primorskyibacter aestuariivivens]
MAFLDRISWTIALLLALTLGLAPFVPEPHIWEKLSMLAAGKLRAPIDMLDLAMHGAPWLLLLAKGLRAVKGRSVG